MLKCSTFCGFSGTLVLLKWKLVWSSRIFPFTVIEIEEILTHLLRRFFLQKFFISEVFSDSSSVSSSRLASFEPIFGGLLISTQFAESSHSHQIHISLPIVFIVCNISNVPKNLLMNTAMNERQCTENISLHRFTVDSTLQLNFLVSIIYGRCPC